MEQLKCVCFFFVQSVSRCRGGLPVAAAAKEPHDLPGGLILPLGEQTSSVWKATKKMNSDFDGCYCGISSSYNYFNMQGRFQMFWKDCVWRDKGVESVEMRDINNLTFSTISE